MLYRDEYKLTGWVTLIDTGAEIILDARPMKNWANVLDLMNALERRFGFLREQSRLTPVVGDVAGSEHGDGTELPAARLNPGR